MPGVTYEKTVQFTPHGAVVAARAHRAAAGRPGRSLPARARARARHGARRPAAGDADREGRLEPGDGRRASTAISSTRPTATRRASSCRAACSCIRRSRRARRSASTRPACCTSTASSSSAPGAAPASAGRSAGSTRRRRPGQVVLFTPAYGARTPVVAGAAEIVLQPFPRRAPEHRPHRDRDRDGAAAGPRSPPDGAVLMAAGRRRRELQAEAPVGTPLDDAADPAAHVDGRRLGARWRPRARAERQAGLPLARGLHERPGQRSATRAPASASLRTAASSSSRSTAASPATASG